MLSDLRESSESPVILKTYTSPLSNMETYLVKFPLAFSKSIFELFLEGLHHHPLKEQN